MKYLITLFLSAFGCAGAEIPEPSEPAALEHRLSLSLVGATMMGHACAVDTYILTAGHIAAPRMGGKITPQSYTWSDGKKSGWLTYNNLSSARDLGMLAVMMGDTPDYQYRQEIPATVGQNVSWYEFVYTNGRLFEVIRRESKVERLLAGHIVTTDSPNPGASGSCLFNARNEVIGIITWSMADSGVSVDLTGSWWPFLDE